MIMISKPNLTYFHNTATFTASIIRISIEFTFAPHDNASCIDIMPKFCNKIKYKLHRLYL